MNMVVIEKNNENMSFNKEGISLYLMLKQHQVMKSEVERLSEQIAESRIPLWQRYTLSIEEAADYYHIGENKLRDMVCRHSLEPFVIVNGNRVLIKRKKFEEFLDGTNVI